MEIKKVSASLGLTMNLGNYESARVDFSAEAEVDKEDNVDQTYDKLVDLLQRRLKAETEKFGIKS